MTETNQAAGTTALSREQFRPGAMALLSSPDDFQSIVSALQGYRHILSAASGMQDGKEADREHLHFEKGKAIGTFWAAKCLDEPLRTKRFVCGLYKAILDLRRKISNRPIRVLYAGTGPFATLMLPVVAVLDPSDVQFSLLEINPATFGYLQQTINNLQLGAYIASMECCDATTCRIPAGQIPDIIVSETMQHALTREMQVPLTFNLAAQAPEAILVPRQVRLELGWFDSGSLERRLTRQQPDPAFYRGLGEFFRLDRSAVTEYGKAFESSAAQFSFPQRTFDLQPDHELEELAFFTSIHVYGDEHLGLNQCSLTIPYKVSRLFREIPRQGRIRLGYQVSAVPGPELELAG
jgi:hypothetical protein